MCRGHLLLLSRRWFKGSPKTAQGAPNLLSPSRVRDVTGSPERIGPRCVVALPLRVEETSRSQPRVSKGEKVQGSCELLIGSSW